MFKEGLQVSAKELVESDSSSFIIINCPVTGMVVGGSEGRQLLAEKDGDYE